MAKITIPTKQAINSAINKVKEQVNWDDVDFLSIVGLIEEMYNGEMAKHIKAALREHDYMIADEEDLFDPAVLTREISRKSGIQFTNVLDKNAVMNDMDHFISTKFNDALGTNVSGLSNMDGLKREMVNMIVAQVANGRVVGVMSRVTAGIIRKGVVYSKSFTGQPIAFDLKKHARKLDNRWYMIKYRRNNQQVWD